MYGFGGNFAWMGLHLWYLLMLFVFSGLMLPVFQWIRLAQRIPVRIKLAPLPENVQLRFGFTASVMILSGDRDK